MRKENGFMTATNGKIKMITKEGTNIETVTMIEKTVIGIVKGTGLGTEIAIETGVTGIEKIEIETGTEIEIIGVIGTGTTIVTGTVDDMIRRSTFVHFIGPTTFVFLFCILK